ncbi:hypothetical protein FAZ95_06895 [Trinickia violacea]|uniref:Uncharacterized protein n=1 Tax=Trinickia violacea TaxID=2571746 RepID=A0A4P8IPJ5_9BURK|nr:hypothetical protein [Trinickia violacea]QCP48933.1 hypothetical protein FAZ95_06895 [Trinickia violacea]
MAVDTGILRRIANVGQANSASLGGRISTRFCLSIFPKAAISEPATVTEHSAGCTMFGVETVEIAGTRAIRCIKARAGFQPRQLQNPVGHVGKSPHPVVSQHLSIFFQNWQDFAKKTFKITSKLPLKRLELIWPDSHEISALSC